jgi:hypothetical protein
VIVVVEGPSAAGKTTWIAQHCEPATVIAEATASVMAAAPDRHQQPQMAAEYWAALGASRWEQAQQIERACGIAVCDGDPFKLHYMWSLWRTGHATREDWNSELEANRRAFTNGRLGLADLFLVTIPDRSTLFRRRSSDQTRRRHNFDVHVQLGAPLTDWYRAVEQLDPKRVIWQLPAEGLPKNLAGRVPNTGMQLVEAVLRHLPTS